MRHGRKTRSKSFNGYKSHIAVDLDSDIILACAVTPANAPETSAVEDLAAELDVAEWYIDRGYIAAKEIQDSHRAGATIICRPWPSQAHGQFGKAEFRFNFRKKTLTCPNDVTIPIQLGHTVAFPTEQCAACTMRSDCTSAKRGRNVNVLADEPLQQRLRTLVAKQTGRAKLRERVAVEHKLAHHAQKQGRKARYIGLRNNVFDSRRHAAVLNLEVAHAYLAA